MYAADSALRSVDLQREVSVLSKRIKESEEATANLQQQVLETFSRPGKRGQSIGLAAADRQAISNVETANRGMDQRLAALESALLQTPEKAVALPLLRQQLSDVQDKNKGDSDSLHGEINRLYGMMQWFLGLMMTLIIGVGGLAVNSFRQSSEKNKSGEGHKHPEPENQTPSTVMKPA